MKWALAAVAFVVVMLPQPAAAAPGGIQVSPDGVSYSNSYPGTLFDGIGPMVPGDSEQQSFFLRNSGTEAGFLRITLTDVVAADTDFADALTVSATTAGQAGSAATVSQANPCWVLTEGQRVNPGERVQVTTALALGNLDGASGQGATADLALNVVLSSVAAQLPPTSCGQAGTTVPVVTQPRPAPLDVTPGEAEASNPAPDAPPHTDEKVDLPVLNLPGLLGIDPNTWRLFEEYLVFVLIGAFIVGTAWFGFIAWRRRKNEADPEPEEGAAG